VFFIEGGGARITVRGGRPLSPFEEITGERFSDHCSPEDRKLDVLLARENYQHERLSPRVLDARILEAKSDGLDRHEIAAAYGVSEDRVYRTLRAAGLEGEPLWCAAGHWWKWNRSGREPAFCPDHRGYRDG
jgi:hypothetical protein